MRLYSSEPAVRRPYPVPRAMTVEEVERTIVGFADAAELAMSAGFDGVELHGAYGYLIQQFLSSTANLRTDRYGGDLAGRRRFVLELVDAVAARIGAGHLALRLSPGCTAFGLVEDEVDELYRGLVDQLPALGYLHLFEWPGHRALTVDLRRRWPGVFVLNPHAAWTDFPAGADALRVVDDGLADVVALGTMFISNPDLVERLRAGAPLAPADDATFYRGDHRGYTNYPRLMTTTSGAAPGSR